MSAQIEQIVTRQRMLALSGQANSIAFRKQQLLKLRELIAKNEQELYQAISEDFHKSEFDTFLTELSQVYSELNLALKNIEKWSRPKRVFQGIINFPGRSQILPEPLGHTLIIGAWNYPYNLTLIPAISALAAGNCCIIKPSELPSKSAGCLAKIINDHFDPGYLHVIEGGPEVTQELLKHSYGKIFFTGSTNVGKIVARAAAEHLTPVTLELGGKSPCIVLEDADLKVSARRIAWGKFINAGQTCVAPDFLLVQKSIYEPFINELKTQISFVAGADPKKSESYCRIINSRHLDRLTRLMNPSQVIYGGHVDPAENFISPTLLGGVSFSDEIMKEEIFGPLLPLIAFDSLDTVIDELKKHPKPLALYLFTRNSRHIKTITSQLPFGGGAINDTVMHLANHRLPFGGVGSSGTGSYHGVAGFKTFSHYKSLLYRPFWFEAPIKYLPYTRLKSWLIRLLTG